MLSDTTVNRPVRFTNWLDDIFDETFNLTAGTFTPELNVWETDKEFEITVALPGMSKDDIEISMENGVLTISGERKAEQEENGRRYHHVESRFGRFRRSLPLPDIVDYDNIQANYENGVLSITVPKLKEKAGKKIKVN
ncbi:MAG: Hsp20/alpha crystallin family protein [Balneolaceae bacterium]